MKIEKYEKIGSSKYRLYLDNGEVIDTYDDVILKNDLLLKKEISVSLYNQILIDTRVGSYYQACVNHIKFRIRSIKEIKEFLNKKNASGEDIELVIKKLVDNKLVDDRVFTECFIKDKLQFTTMGKYRIIQELKKHNIDNLIIDEYEYLMDDSVMYDKLDRLMKKKIEANNKLDDNKLRNKLYNHFLGLGYSSSLIVKLLNKYF